jgi:hypothetical protein
MLDRHLAALVLASENKINIHKYSTPDQRAELRGVLHSGSSEQADRHGESTARNAAAPVRKAPVHQRKARAKSNSVFVVYGRNERLRKSMFDFLRALAGCGKTRLKDVTPEML